MTFNMQSRLYYDNDVKKNNEMNSERTLKWYTSEIQQNRALATTNTLDIDVSNKLYKTETTDTKQRDNTNTELYGTAPFLGRLPDGNSNNIAIESSLLHGGIHRAHNCWNKQVYEPTYVQSMPGLQVESRRGGISTRNDAIRYCNEK